MVIHLGLMKKIDYFADLSEAELELIKKYVSEQTVDAGDMFLSEGKRSSYIYFVISGVVNVNKRSPDGKEQVMNMATTGESLNDVSTFNGNVTAANMLAMTPVILYRIKKKDMKELLENHPKVALNALKVLASRVRRDSGLVRDLSFTQVTGRLAKMLLTYFAGAKTDEWPRFTQHDMAAIVGTTREVVNRSLRDMEKKGAIRLERHGIVILDESILEKMIQSPS
jgi:CRP/FNR family cyclic AMP-dependent transcriptional regulator